MDIILCTECFEEEHNYEPDMGEDMFTFFEGTCTNCHRNNLIVWKVIDW